MDAGRGHVSYRGVSLVWRVRGDYLHLEVEIGNPPDAIALGVLQDGGIRTESINHPNEMNNHNGDRVIENRFARTLRELRWRNGRLQMLHEYKYEQYADNMGKKGRFIGSGVRAEHKRNPES